jgi:hypothetical protein
VTRFTDNYWFINHGTYDVIMSKNERNEAPELSEIRRELNQVAWPSDVDKLINLINLYKDHAVEAVRMRTTPPIIRAVASSNLTNSSVKITWTTDEPGDSVVKYGATTATGSMVSDAAMVTDHTLTLTGLEDGATYYYLVASTDSVGNRSVDNKDGTYYTFKI